MRRFLTEVAAGALVVVVAVVLSLVGVGAVVSAQGLGDVSAKGSARQMSIRQQGRVRAPELEGGRGWLNTDRPLSLAALRGKVVLLDFWTYGCINCVHIIPDLQRLEEKYARQLVVIGVHSAKFDNEKETENIRRVVLRYGVEHPVVNDADFQIWESYAVRAWPTQVLIDPEGYVVGKVAGEGHYEELDAAVGELVAEYRKRGTLDERPLKLALERAKTADLPLAFPGKVLADERGGRLFITDSNHNRIVVTTLDGKLVETIGSGERGGRDGAFAQASFYRPQGLALDGDFLYVADTANHLVRRADLKTKTVTTVAGTGRQARGGRGPEVVGGFAVAADLSSPWDLLVVGRTLYIAMAGPHQIWSYHIPMREVGPFAGSGREARRDGPRAEAAFAQPSGLASDGKTLYVADSESNIIRAVELKEGGGVSTLVGGDLFEFGDADGEGDDVRLQHPLGLAFHEGKVFVADTYNHKIKQLDPAGATVKTFAGTGRPGQADGASPSFYEPGGLAVAGGKLYVADTNNHAVRVVDLRTRQTSTLKIDGLRAPEVAAGGASAGESDVAPNAEEIALASQRVGANGAAELVIEVALPEGYHLNPSAPQRFRVTIERGVAHLAPGVGGEAKSEAKTGAVAPSVGDAKTTPPAIARTSKDLSLPLRIPLRALAPGEAELRAQVTLFYCREDNTGTCRIKTLVWRAPVVVTSEAGAPREIRARGSVE